MITRSARRRFWSHVNKNGPLPNIEGWRLGVCWIWTASCQSWGYGQIMVDGRMWRAHRLVWLLWYGSIPKDLDVCHSCDNRKCVRPSHLFVGTRKDNMQDAKHKGRLHRTPSSFRAGAEHVNAKLTDEIVRAIRANATKDQRGRWRTASLAEKYAVHRDTITMILNRVTWTHLADIPRVDPIAVVADNAGETNPFAKLTDANVIEARRRYAAGESLFVIAEDYGVKKSTMHAALTGKTWKHVTTKMS